MLLSRVVVLTTRASLPGIFVDISARKTIAGELMMTPLRLNASVITELRVSE